MVNTSTSQIVSIHLLKSTLLLCQENPSTWQEWSNKMQLSGMISAQV